MDEFEASNNSLYGVDKGMSDRACGFETLPRICNKVVHGGRLTSYPEWHPELGKIIEQAKLAVAKAPNAKVRYKK